MTGSAMSYMRYVKQLAPGSALAVAAITIASVWTAVFGPLFDAWDWRATALRLLLLAALALLSLAGVRGDQNPYSPVAPSSMFGMHGAGQPADIPHGQMLDAQLLYGGAGVPVADDARMTGDNRWFWVALPPAVAFVVLLLPIW